MPSLEPHHRPRFHIRPEQGLVNDPNGPVVIDGTAHLFFQYRSPIAEDSLVLWGHAVSTDLVRWRLDRPALVPHPTRGDRGGCWSGNTVLHDGVLHAFYSGFRSDHPYQSVQLARSVDGGRSFGDPNQVVDDPVPDERIRTFRDPFVWRAEDGWWMVVGAGDADGTPSARLYRADRLEQWSYVRSLTVPSSMSRGGALGAMWECPQVLPLDGEEVLLVGTWTPEAGIGHVLSLTGLLAGETVLAHRVDHGPDFYAASVLRESPSGPVIWGWVTEAAPNADLSPVGWAGTISLPRLVSRGPDGSVRSRPHPAVDTLRAELLDPSGPIPSQLEAVLTSDTDGPGSMTLHFSAQERLVVELDPARRSVTMRVIDHSGSRTEVMTLVDAFDLGGPTRVRLFLDGSVLELFSANGRVATARTYPTAAPPWRATVQRLLVTAWRLA